MPTSATSPADTSDTRSPFTNSTQPDVTKIVVGSIYKDPGLTRLTPRLKVDDIDTIANLPRLTELVLFNTAISDVGLVKLANLQQLEWLRLDGSAITDEGLVHLHSLKNLKHLTLTKTAVTGSVPSTAVTDS